MFLPSVTALAMYSLVLVEFRYVAPFALMLLMWMLSRMKIATGAGPLLVRRFQFAIMLAPALAIAWAAGRDIYDVARNKPYELWVVAQRLHEMGISPGTDVGYIGTGLNAYWAHLAGGAHHRGNSRRAAIAAHRRRGGAEAADSDAVFRSWGASGRYKERRHGQRYGRLAPYSGNASFHLAAAMACCGAGEEMKTEVGAMTKP